MAPAPRPGPSRCCHAAHSISQLAADLECSPCRNVICPVLTPSTCDGSISIFPRRSPCLRGDRRGRINQSMSGGGGARDETPNGADFRWTNSASVVQVEEFDGLRQHEQRRFANSTLPAREMTAQIAQASAGCWSPSGRRLLFLGSFIASAARLLPQRQIGLRHAGVERRRGLRAAGENARMTTQTESRAQTAQGANQV